MERRTEADALAEQVFEALLEEALVDVVQLVHRSRRLGFEPGGEDEAVGPPATAQPAHGADVWGQRHPPLASEEVCCPVCARLLSAGRFAPHLEKCTGKGRRAAGKTAPREPLYVPSWTPRVKRPKLAPPPGASAPPPVAPASRLIAPLPSQLQRPCRARSAARRRTALSARLFRRPNRRWPKTSYLVARAPSGRRRRPGFATCTPGRVRLTRLMRTWRRRTRRPPGRRRSARPRRCAEKCAGRCQPR